MLHIIILCTLIFLTHTTFAMESDGSCKGLSPHIPLKNPSNPDHTTQTPQDNGTAPSSTKHNLSSGKSAQSDNKLVSTSKK